MRSRSTLALCALPLLAAAAARGQFVQYSDPGSLALEEKSRAEQAQEKAEQARWTLGKWRVAPDIALHDVAWVDNVYDSSDDAEGVSDVTGTLRAGLEGFLHLGPDVLFSLYGRPSYTYWQDQEDLRSSHVSFGAGLFGLHNRLTWEVVAERSEEQSFANDELRVPLDLERDQVSAGFEVVIRRPLSLFVRAQEAEARYPARTPEGGPEVDLTPLDRNESLLAAQLVYRPGDQLRIGAGVERSEVDFDNDLGGRSNRATSPLLTADVAGNRVQLELSAALRAVEFDNPELGDTDEVTGRGRLAWRLGTRSVATVYGGRSLVYSALDDASYYTSGVVGGQLGWSSQPDQRGVLVALIAETAANRYEGAPGGLAGRADDITSYGVTFAVPYRRLLTFEIGLVESEIDSNLPEFDRSYTRIRTGLRLEPLGPGR